MRIWSIGGDPKRRCYSMPPRRTCGSSGWQCMFGPSPYIGVHRLNKGLGAGLATMAVVGVEGLTGWPCGGLVALVAPHCDVDLLARGWAWARPCLARSGGLCTLAPIFLGIVLVDDPGPDLPRLLFDPGFSPRSGWRHGPGGLTSVWVDPAVHPASAPYLWPGVAAPLSFERIGWSTYLATVKMANQR